MSRPKNTTPRLKLTVIYGDETTKTLSIRTDKMTDKVNEKLTAFVNECLKN